MNEKRRENQTGSAIDAKIAADWAVVDARRAELTLRDGGDTRRQAIMKRLGLPRR
jgi:hypothetical protein